MLGSSFTPGRDGRSDWDLSRSEGLPTWLIRSEFADAQAQALDELHHEFFDAVEIYNLACHILRWVDRAALTVCAREAGKFNLILDYHRAGLPLPRYIRRLKGKKTDFFHRYFDQRSLDNLRVNLANLLKALAILSLVPDNWFPLKALEERIEEEVRQLGVYRQVQVDCRLSLPPGGMRWMARATQQAIAKVKVKLANGQPCLVRLVRSLEALEGNRQAIVYSYQEMLDGSLRLEVFEPDCVLEEHALQLTLRGEQVEIFEIAPPGRPLPVLGLLYEAYTPVAPPAKYLPWWIRIPGVRRLWQIIHKPHQTE